MTKQLNEFGVGQPQCPECGASAGYQKHDNRTTAESIRTLTCIRCGTRYSLYSLPEPPFAND